MKFRRKIIQVLSAFAMNADLPNFANGRIHTGRSKMICVPGLNCYSCPGALGACPIGSLQAVIGHRGNRVPVYVIGFLLMFGALFGRLICGFLCPFGLIQELLHKIPLPKLRVNSRIDHALRYLKYIVLVVFVLLLPALLPGQFGIVSPYFCKLICPAGTLEGAIPLMLKVEGFRNMAGSVFDLKIAVLIITIILSILIFRPFCKYICPLGAIYALFNKVSFYTMHVDSDKCVNCKMCVRACKMNVDVLKDINSAECIRCGDCRSACAYGAIRSGFEIRPAEKAHKESV